MKMDQADFEALKRDFLSVVEQVQATRSVPYNYSHVRIMWDVFHVVELDRTNDDSHPLYTHASGRPRYVPFVDRKASLYNKGYNDAHIETALKRIAAA